MSRILILGFEDLLTYQVSKTLSEESENTIILATPNAENTNFVCDKAFVLDFEDNAELNSLIRKNNPSVIINTLVLSNDKNKISSDINLYNKYIDNLLFNCDKANARLIHFSNSKVFSGKKGLYDESDTRDAEDEYGKNLILIEDKISNLMNNYTIIRYSEYFGANSNFNDFAMDFINKLEDNIEIHTDNIIFNPIYINDFCYFLYFVIDKNKKGIYHIGAKDEISHFDIMKKIADITEYSTDLIKLNESETLNYTLSIFKAESEQIYNFSKVENYLVSLKHFLNMSNKFYYNPLK
jgi:dTDP-4-dehydrorhamnose reductase